MSCSPKPEDNTEATLNITSYKDDTKSPYQPAETFQYICVADPLPDDCSDDPKTCLDGWDDIENFWSGLSGFTGNKKAVWLKHHDSGSVIAIMKDGNIIIYAERGIKIMAKESIQIKSKGSIVIEACENICVKAGKRLTFCAEYVVFHVTERFRIKAWEFVSHFKTFKVCSEAIDFLKNGLTEKPKCAWKKGEPKPDVECGKCTVSVSCHGKGKCIPHKNGSPMQKTNSSECSPSNKNQNERNKCDEKYVEKPYIYPPLSPDVNDITAEDTISILSIPDSGCDELVSLIVDGEDVGPVYNYPIGTLREDITVIAIFRERKIIMNISPSEGMTVVPTGELTVKCCCSKTIKCTPKPKKRCTAIVIGPHVIPLPIGPHIYIPPIKKDDPKPPKPYVRPRNPSPKPYIPPHKSEPEDPIVLPHIPPEKPIIPPRDTPITPIYKPIIPPVKPHIPPDGPVTPYDTPKIPKDPRDPLRPKITPVRPPTNPYDPDDPYNPYRPYDPDDPDNPYNPNYPHHPLDPYVPRDIPPFAPTPRPHDPPNIPCDEEEEEVIEPQYEYHEPLETHQIPDGEIWITFEQIEKCINVTIITTDEDDPPVDPVCVDPDPLLPSLPPTKTCNEQEDRGPSECSWSEVII